MKTIVTLIPGNLVTRSLLYFVVLLQKPKTRIKLLKKVGGLLMKNTSVFC